MRDTVRVGQAAALVEQFAAEWQSATHHPFLDAVADGSMPPFRFDAWLAQDYQFVSDLLMFQAGLLARAPRVAQGVLVAGLSALVAELSWFEDHAVRRGLALHVQRQPITARYEALLQDLERSAYAVAMIGVWAIERSYLDAWRSALPGAAAFREFVEHWTVPAFGEYVAGLEKAADLALFDASPDVRQTATTTFLEVARMEHAFWDMAWAERKL